MVPKPEEEARHHDLGFRAVLFRMVPKLQQVFHLRPARFRAVLFRMVPKQLCFQTHL